VQVSLDTSLAETTAAGLLCIGIFDGEDLPPWLADAPGAGDVRTAAKKLTVLRPAGADGDDAPPRVLVVGLGKRDDFDSERARGAAALGVRQAARYEVDAVAWEVPGGAPATACALAGATIMAAYRFDRLKSKPDPDAASGGPKALLLHGVDDPDGSAAELVAVASAAAQGANRARDLQNLPANIADPEYLAERARAIAGEHDSVSVEVFDGERIAALGMGGLQSVGAGSAKEPLMIVLRHEPPGATGETLAIVGKAVTFDTGGISLKPSASMQEMKMDMSGGAAALEATATIAELGIPLKLLTVVPAVENMPGGNATRPGDVITQLNGRTVEVNNTDAEGRLILADALTWAARNGADRMIDLATLTGAVVVALGSTYAAVAGTDEELAAAIVEAGGITGELAWRMPMHPEYLELMKGTVADLSNAAPKRKAGSLTATAFLGEFVEDKPWAHIDIAGTAWDVGRPYVGKGPSGYGVRLLVELARGLAAETTAQS
jgi:leucyl aminopeptidase